MQSAATKKPGSSELGNLIAVIPRPLGEMRRPTIAGVVLVILFSLSRETSVAETFVAAAVVAILLLVLKHLGAVRVFELGLKSKHKQMLWKNLVAYRFSWSLVSEEIVLIEQTTGREISMSLAIFQSEQFRDAVADRANLDSLVKVGRP